MHTHMSKLKYRGFPLDVTSSRVTACSHAGRQAIRLHKPVTDWLETLPRSVYGLNM